MRNEPADLLWSSENHVGAVAHHAGSNEGRRALLRAVIADIGLEAQVALPEIANLAVGGPNLVSVGAVIDRLHPILGIKLLEMGHPAAAHHHAAHLIAALRDPGRVAGPGGVLEEREQIGALPRGLDPGKRHRVPWNEVL